MIKKYIFIGLLFLIGFVVKAQIMLPAYHGALFSKKANLSYVVSNALDFDGLNDFVNCGANASLDLKSSMTIELWIKPNQNMGNGKWDRLVHRNWPTGYFFGGKAGANNALAVVLSGDLNAAVTPNNTVVVGAWQHVAFVFDDAANTIKIYKDANLISTAVWTGTITGNPSSTLTLSESSETFNGTMDDVRIWNVARSQAEIQSNMNKELSGSETGLVAYYTFNQGIAAGDNSAISTITDKTTNSVNGTLTNFNKVGATSNFVVGKVTNSVIVDGLVLNLDAAVSASYSGSGTTWNDISGSGNNATLNGAVFTNLNGTSYFNFSNTYVNTTLTKSASMTFSTWAKTSDPTNCMLFNTGNPWNGSVGGPDLFFYTGNLYWNTWDSGNNPFGFSASNINANWHNYTIVNDATSNTKLYFDGVLVGSATYKSPTYTNNLYIGSAGIGDSWFWKGAIANFQAYNRSLTPSEILQNYNVLKPRFN